MNGSANPLEFFVRRLSTHRPLSSEDAEILLRLPYKLRTFEAQSYLIREGDRPNRCGIIVSGYAYRHKLTGDGARQILALHIAGDAVDFQNMFLDESDHNIQMLARGEVAEVPLHLFEDLVFRRPEIGRAILVTSLVEASIFREWTLNIGRRDSRSRIAHLLCEFAYRLRTMRLDGENGYELPMTQEQLGDTTGLTPVHVNRVLKSLQAEGLIERDRRSIRFPDWQRMRDVGDFNPRYLHVPADAA